MGARARLILTAVAVAAAGLWVTGEPGAQEYGRPYELSPDAALPAFGGNRVQVVAPEPRVRVTDPQTGDPRGRNRALRRSIEELSEPTDGSSRRTTQQTTTPTEPRTPSRPVTTPAPPPRDRSAAPSPSSWDRGRPAAPSRSEAPSRTTMRRAPGREAAADGPVEYGRLIVITGFDDIDVTIDGQTYPYGSMQGVLLYAGEQYEVVLEQAEDAVGGRGGGPTSRAIPIRLDAGETRILMANLGGEAPRTPARTEARDRTRATRTRSVEPAQSQAEIGYLGVSSSPRGMVYVDGQNTGQMTPARRIELEPGRHEVRIFYESEDEFSETKNVLIREGVNTNVFFRLRRDEPEEDVEAID
jgi:hypothetical protein